MTTERRSAATSVDVWWLPSAVGWLSLQLFVTVFAMLHTFFSTLSIASCTDTSCDYSAFAAATNTLYVGAIALAVASLLAVFLLRAHGRAMIWPPIVCSALLILLLVVTYIAGRAALTLPLFGNRLGCC